MRNFVFRRHQAVKGIAAERELTLGILVVVIEWKVEFGWFEGTAALLVVNSVLN